MPDTLPNPNALTNWQPIAQALGIKERSFWDLLHQQGLPHYRINSRVYRFRWSEVERWLEHRKVES